MPNPLDRRVNDNPSTYFVQDRKSKKELTRLTVQGRMMTVAMGGVLSEHADPTVFHRVLDIGCGPGGWAIDAAQAYPTMSLVGIDISQRMIEYARTQAKAHQISNQVEFCIMDALHPLEFSTASFDLVNLRFGISFVRTWDWPKFVSELLRVTCPGGVVRITEGDTAPRNNSPALTRLYEMLVCALYQAGHLFEKTDPGLTTHLAGLLDQYGCDQVQTKAYALKYLAGTAEGQAFCEDAALFLQTFRPFIQKWGTIDENYEVLHQQALKEMQQPDFHVTWDLLTAWGNKPKPKPKPLQQ